MNHVILYRLQLNIVFLLIISFFITRPPVIQKILTDKKKTLGDRLAQAALFGGISVCSTYMGVSVDGMIVNTRVIGVLAAGLFAGPFAGVGAGLFAAAHRLFYDPGGFTTVACSLSTLSAGLLGALFHDFYSRARHKRLFEVLLAAGAETLHMLLILLLSSPFALARSVVSRTALPMVLLNSLGLTIFMSVFNQLWVQRDRDSAVRVRDTLRIADESLPYMRRGLAGGESLDRVIDIILRSGICEGVIFSDLSTVLASGWTGERAYINKGDALPQFLEHRVRAGAFAPDIRAGRANPDCELTRQYQMIAAPLVVRDKPVGSMTLVVKRKFLARECDATFAQGLARIFSTQLELAEMDDLKRQYRAAELKALRSQINPHFLYNALNTISCVCREQPGRARELLLTLAAHYRHTLDGASAFVSFQVEIGYIENYLVLEKARFEEKLAVEYHFDCDMKQIIPAFILQPLVENAIKYGADRQGMRRVSLSAEDRGGFLAVVVSDQGQGFPQQVLDGFADASFAQRHFGLFNVDRRLKYMYGPDCGLKLSSSPRGASVEVRFAKTEHLISIEEDQKCV